MFLRPSFSSREVGIKDRDPDDQRIMVEKQKTFTTWLASTMASSKGEEGLTVLTFWPFNPGRRNIATTILSNVLTQRKGGLAGNK
jgi:hypothetical protein